MNVRIHWLACTAIAVAAACSAPSNSASGPASDNDPIEHPLVSNPVVNGSFETGDYTGWTLIGDSSSAWGIEGDETLSPNTQIHDFATGGTLVVQSPGLPITYHATDGSLLAIQEQTGAGERRMSQVVTVPSGCTPIVQWDMFYSNEFGSAADDPTAPFSSSQSIAVRVRDTSDNILATPFITTTGIDNPFIPQTMTPYRADLSAFAGQTVKLDYDMNVFNFFFDAAYDNIRIDCATLTYSADHLVFPSTPIGASSSEQQIQVNNVSSSQFALQAFSVTGPFKITTTPPTPNLAPGTSAPFGVEYVPTATGLQYGFLNVTYNDADGPVAIRLVGTGGGSPHLAFNPSEVDFGNVQVGQVETVNLVLENTGTSTLTINSSNIAAPYSLAQSFPITIAANSQTTVQVTFTPTTPGAIDDTFQLASNDPSSPSSLVMTGTGTGPSLSGGGTLDFGDQRVNITSTTQPMTFCNNGAGPVTINQIAVTGDYHVTSTPSLPETLQPGACDSANVAFRPTTLGTETAVGTVSGTAPDVTYNLTGVGVESQVSLSANPLDFGTVALGSASQAIETVTNNGTAALDLTNIATSGPFSYAGSTSITIQPGSSANLSLTFSPTASGAATGKLQFNSDDPNNGAVNVSLTGQGAQAVAQFSPSPINFGQVVANQSQAGALTVENNGNATLVISSITVSGAAFQLTSTGQTSILPGGQTQFGFTFTPTGQGTFNGSVTFASNSQTSPDTVVLTGVGVAPTAGVSPTSLAFGNQRINITSAAQTFTLSNTGTSVMNVSAITASAGFAATTTQQTPFQIAAGGNVTVSVTFTPTSEGAKTGTVTVTSDQQGGATTVSLTGTGTAPHISLGATAIAFGNQRVGTTGTQTLNVTNVGTANLHVHTLTTAAPFTDADATPITIAPSASKTLTVTFTPSAEGSASGALAIASDDAGSPATVTLTGTGILPHTTLSATALAFGNQRIHTTSAAQIVTVTNSGTDTLHISADTTASPYVVTALDSLTVAPNGTSRFSVTFAPTADGAANGTLTITSDSPSSPDTVTLTGTGVEPFITVNPTSLAFGNQRLGTTSTAKTFSISNPGTSVLTVSAITVAGAFAVSGQTTPFQVGVGSAATVSVTFAPTADGAQSNNITITSDAAASPTTVAVTGIGVEPQVTASTTTLAFGDVKVGTTSASQTIGITNSGTSPLTISAATATAGFTVTPPSGFPITVLPSGKASFGVTFSPTATGQATGSVTITSDATSSPTVVATSGNGVQPVISVDPTANDFGNQLVGTTSTPETFTISNPGTAAFNVTGLSVFAPFQIVSPPTLPAAVAPGGTLQFSVVFAPTAHASAFSQLQISTDAGNTAVSLSGVGVAPVLTSSLTSVDFGNVTVDTTSTLAVQLQNTGDSPLTISQLALSGVNAGDFALVPQPTLPATVAANDSLTVNIAFTPSNRGSRTATLTATSDSFGGATTTVPLSGDGIGGKIVLSASSLAFGSANVGDTAEPQVVVVSNTGDADLTINQIAFGGANAADFGDDANLPLTIQAGGSATIDFDFTPSAIGARTASATLSTTDPLTPTSSIALTGTGTSPTIGVSPSSLPFGDVRVGQSSQQTITVSNTGTGPLTISSVTLSGGDAAQFSFAPLQTPLVIAPGGTATVSVTFAPTTLGSAGALITILSDDSSDASIAIPLSGDGVSPTVAVSPSDVDYGGQLVGHTSAIRQVTIQNTGTGVLNVTQLALTGANASNFAIVSPPALPAKLNAGNQLIISVTVTPAAAGAVVGELDVTTDSPDAPNASVGFTALGISTALSATPTTIDFGTAHTPVAIAAIPVTITNLTGDTITLTDGVLTGASPGDFSVTSVAGPLAAGASTTAMVSYVATAAATSAATLTFGSTDPTIPQVVVSLSGKAVSSFIEVDHMEVDFGAFDVGDHSGPKTIDVTNITTAPITVGSVVSSDEDFTVDATALIGSALAPGATGMFTIAFAPTKEGPLTGGVAITLQGFTQPELTVAVTGTGDAQSNTGCSTSGGGGGLLVVAAAIAAVARRRRRR